MSLENMDNREEEALDALIIASLRASELKNDISEKDIEDFTNAGLILTDEEEKDIVALGNDFFNISKEKIESVVQEDIAEYETEVMAMNRSDGTEKKNKKLKDEIIKKREEIKKKLKQKRKQKNDDS